MKVTNCLFTFVACMTLCIALQTSEGRTQDIPSISTTADQGAGDKSVLQKEQIPIILEEYKSLRTELLERHTAFMQLITFSITGLVAAIGLAIAHRALAGGVITCLALLGTLCFGVLFLDNDTRLLSTRLQQIEAEVNRRSGDQLLVWESTRGIEKLGYVERIKQTWRRLMP